MTDFDIDSFINDDYNNDECSSTEFDEFSNQYLNSYNLIFFTDGSCCGNGRESGDSRNKAGFGIYIMCNDTNSKYYIHNDVKCIKKIDKDFIMFNNNTYDNIYYNLTHKNESETKCKNEECTYHPRINEISNLIAIVFYYKINFF